MDSAAAPSAPAPVSLDQFEAVIHELGKAVATLPPGPLGRQHDAGANLQYTGYVLLLQYEDPGMPGKVYTADASEWHTADPSQARFVARQNLSIVNGVVGGVQNMLTAFLDNFGELKPVLGILSSLGKLTPILSMLIPGLPALNLPTSPANLISMLLGKREIPGAKAAKQIEAGLKS